MSQFGSSGQEGVGHLSPTLPLPICHFDIYEVLLQTPILDHCQKENTVGRDYIANLLIFTDEKRLFTEFGDQ